MTKFTHMLWLKGCYDYFKVMQENFFVFSFSFEGVVVLGSRDGKVVCENTLGCCVPQKKKNFSRYYLLRGVCILNPLCVIYPEVSTHIKFVFSTKLVTITFSFGLRIMN